MLVNNIFKYGMLQASISLPQLLHTTASFILQDRGSEA